MRSDARLESLVFQLTPTRTRCDLVITSDGKTEKIASGLLNPFLNHLKTARDQNEKGGYSIILKPDSGVDVVWFNKNTVERFVRFVSTPQVLERVNIIESEILQIEEAIIIQGKECVALGNAEDRLTRSVKCVEGSTTAVDGDADKAIVLYKPGEQLPESNGSAVQSENSKVQLLRVLENRKTVLQKEQAMAFARAAAAGFDMDKVAHLISFSECFGASRLLTACVKFMEIWKGKHETGQWIEIEAAEAMPMRSDHYFYLDPSKEGNSNDTQVPVGSPEYSQGQFQHPMFPQWPIHSPPGAAVFQHYPIQGMPYHQNFPGSAPFFQHPYSPMEDPRFNSQRNGSGTRSQDDIDQNTADLEKEGVEDPSSNRKVGQSGKKQSDVVVIQNISYITSKRRDTSGSDSGSASCSENELESKDLHDETPEKRHKRSARFSKPKGLAKSAEFSNSYGEEATNGKETASTNWLAFENFLLRDEDKSRSTSAEQGILSSEKLPPIKRKSNTNSDVILPLGRGFGDDPERSVIEFGTVSGRMILRKKSSNDDLICSNGVKGIKLDERFQEMEVNGRGYRRGSSDDFVIYGQNRQSATRNSIDLLSENAYKFERFSQPNIIDESLMVPSRFGSHLQGGSDRHVDIDIDTEHRTNYSSFKNVNQIRYEPDDLSLMPGRDEGEHSTSYDPAIDYDTEARVNNNIIVENDTRSDLSGIGKQGVKKSEKEKKSKTLQDGLAKGKMDSRWGRPARLKPQAEAHARAEKLRAYKADLQKAKKEKEEQEIKRLEALKKERQKRIVARGSSSTVQSLTTLNQSRVPVKLSPGSRNTSKFSDTEPSPSLLIHKMSRISSVEPSYSQKGTKTSRPSGRQRSSLSAVKKEESSVTPEQKSISRIKRLSDPTGGIKSANPVSQRNNPDIKGHKVCFSSVKSGRTDSTLKNVPGEPQIKKISAIISLDKSKSATLPELKIRKPAGI